MRFLEVERFDRVGRRGRRGVVSLAALDDEYGGRRDSWTRAAWRLAAEPVARIDPEDLRRMRWLDAFGQLLGNSDRHFGNLSFFTEEGPEGLMPRLAPVYDMLPMVLAPQDLAVVERPFQPAGATEENGDVWADAAAHALEAWTAYRDCREFGRAFRALCGRCRDSLAALIAAPGQAPGT
jgi:serine/threonine protein kinase HipA of HipAB toxin-antitoxin module